MGHMVTRFLHEAPEDENQNQAPAEAPADAAEQEAPAEADTPTEDEGGDDEDFNIDTTLDDDDEGKDEENPEDTGEDNDNKPAPENTSSNNGDEEPVEANTDIFSTLTAEEQQIKIGELKSLYKNLYSSVNDLIHRLDNMELDEDVMDVMTKVSDILHRLGDSISDYFEKQFDIRSYFENDVKYNEFLLVLKKTTTIVDDLADTREKRIGIDSTNLKDKNDNI